MSNALTPYQRVTDPMGFVREMGEAIARSQMFGCQNDSQGMVLALACLSQGCDPLSIPQSFHLMHGRLTLRADAMLGRLVQSGGRFDVVEHSPAAAEIVVALGDRECRQRFTWEEAQDEPFVYRGKTETVLEKLESGNRESLKLSANYATPRRRMQHLWARVTSDAVRVVAPHLVTGVYTPTETRGILLDDGAISSMQAETEGIASEAEDGADVEDATFDPAEPAPEGAGPDLESEEIASVEAESEPTVVPGKCHPQQRRRIEELFESLGVPDEKQLAAIKKRGGANLEDLSPEGASDLIAALDARLQQQNDRIVGTSKADNDATEVELDGPVTADIVEEIRGLLRQASQWSKGSGLGSRVREKLKAHGLETLADLSIRDAQKIRDALAKRNLDLFFTASLKGHAGSPGNDGSQRA